MKNQLFGYFLDKFHEFLSAFRKRYSCQSLLLKAVDDWKYALDQNLKTGVVFMDLSEAFDCLPHSLLIAKFHAYGVDWSACELLAESLLAACQDRNRAKLMGGTKQRCTPKALYWDLCCLTYSLMTYFYSLKSVPSIIMPMSYSSSTMQGVLSSLLNDCKIAVEWFGNNGMKANPTKVQFMVLSPNLTDDIELKLDENTILKPEKSVKALGVIIDNRLTFSDHISTCCLKAARQLNALARFQNTLIQNPKMSFIIVS